MQHLPDDAVTYDVDHVASNPDALRGSCAFSRASDTTVAQHAQRTARRPMMPVLAIGGAAVGEHIANTMQHAADDVQNVVMPGSAAEAPEAMVAALTAFLAPLRVGGSAAAHEPRPDPAAASAG